MQECITKKTLISQMTTMNTFYISFRISFYGIYIHQFYIIIILYLFCFITFVSYLKSWCENFFMLLKWLENIALNGWSIISMDQNWLTHFPLWDTKVFQHFTFINNTWWKLLSVTFVHISDVSLTTGQRMNRKDLSILKAAERQKCPLQGPHLASRCHLRLTVSPLTYFLRMVLESQLQKKLVSQWSSTPNIKVSPKGHKSTVPEGCRPGYVAFAVGWFHPTQTHADCWPDSEKKGSIWIAGKTPFFQML